MHLPSSHVFSVLSEKGVTQLHHANSVATACQFIRQKSLLSRGTAERKGVTQTAQSSDSLDRIYSIWFDVFLDSVDIHQRASRANVYGPVLFDFSVGIIDKNKTGRLWVTKLNPTKWADKNEEQRWFQSKVDLEENFILGQFDQMVLARHSGGELPFGKYLKRIVLDDPKHTTDSDIDVHSMAVGALRLAMQDAGIDVPIVRRQCRDQCRCVDYWTQDEDRLLKMFDPKI